jgi:hypothetical protein
MSYEKILNPFKQIISIVLIQFNHQMMLNVFICMDNLLTKQINSLKFLSKANIAAV